MQKSNISSSSSPSFDHIPPDLFAWMIDEYFRERALLELFSLMRVSKRFRNAVLHSHSKTKKRIETFRNTAPVYREKELNRLAEDACRSSSSISLIGWMMKSLFPSLKPKEEWCNKTSEGKSTINDVHSSHSHVFLFLFFSRRKS